MAVQREQFEPADLRLSLASFVSRLMRRRDGTWTFIIRVDGEAELPDGRKITVKQDVGVPANQQIGRRVRRMEPVNA